MRRVLLVAYHFPPSPAVGSLRAIGLAKYLPQFGWEPVVLTVGLPGRPGFGFSVIETEYREPLAWLRRRLGLNPQQNLMTQIAQLKKKLHMDSERSPIDLLLKVWGEFTAYPDLQKGWRRTAVQTVHRYLQQEPVDAIISTASPVTSHIVAADIKEKHRIPWVADFRDLWTQNHYYPYSRLRRAIDRRLEVKTLAAADALVTVSEPLAHRLAKLHQGKHIDAITNAFDPSEVNQPAAPLTEKFTITYTGNLYPGRQSPEPLFAALQSLISESFIDPAKVEVRFYGAQAGWIDAQARRYGLQTITRQYGVVPRETALAAQRESQLLLLLKWDDPHQKGAYSAKIFEYLAARRPILAVGGYEDVVTHLLTETGAGFDAPAPEDIRNVINNAYRQYRETGAVPYTGDEQSIETYSQVTMARRFAEILDKIVTQL